MQQKCHANHRNRCKPLGSNTSFHWITRVTLPQHKIMAGRHIFLLEFFFKYNLFSFFDPFGGLEHNINVLCHHLLS